MDNTTPAQDAPAASPAGFVAIVHGPAGVHFATVAPNRPSLWRSLAAHVRAWAPYQLDEATCALVHAALDGGQEEAAVHLYFGRASRWESELLFVSPLNGDGTASLSVPLDSPHAFPRPFPPIRASRGSWTRSARRP